MSKDNVNFDRRSVLKTITTAAAGGTAFIAGTGGVAADLRQQKKTIEAKARLERTYDSERRLRAAFERYGDDLRETLVDAGFVAESFDFETVAFDLHSDVTGVEPTDEDGRAGVSAIKEDGTMTALGMLSASSDTHDLSLFVQPERGTAYATVEPTGGGDRLLVTDSGVTPTGCTYETCGSCCGVGYSTRKEYRCDSLCQNCRVVSTGCGCSDCECTKEC